MNDVFEKDPLSLTKACLSNDEHGHFRVRISYVIFLNDLL